MKAITPPDDLTSSDFVSLTLRQAALIVDPKLGRLSVLAEQFELHPSTLQVWIKNGRVPRKPCRRLLKRFGRKFINFDRLVGDDINE